MPALTGLVQPEGAVVDVQVCWSAAQAHQLRQALRPVPPPLGARALLDSGAEITCVDGALIQQLGLPMAQLALANIPALGGLQVGAHYHAGMVVVHPSGVPGMHLEVQDLLIMEVPLAGLGYQVLIGRDVLAYCDFLYRGRRQRFALRY